MSQTKKERTLSSPPPHCEFKLLPFVCPLFLIRDGDKCCGTLYHHKQQPKNQSTKTRQATPNPKHQKKSGNTRKIGNPETPVSAST
jgi:hypothetical protein